MENDKNKYFGWQIVLERNLWAEKKMFTILVRGHGMAVIGTHSKYAAQLIRYYFIV